ncbi:MAG: ATP-binding cassette domain-containing protein [Candidatus Binatia bacterium]
MGGVAVEFRDVCFAERGSAPRLSHLDLKIEAGETLILLGRSGSGKTTSLRLVNALLSPTAGEVRIDGRPTTSWDRVELRRRTGYAIQEGGLFPHFTVDRNVALVPSLLGWETQRIRERVREMLTLVGLDPERFGGRLPAELSGGERQRVGVARALAADPPLVLMDEPFGALDPPTREDIRAEFRSLALRLGKTIVFVTHDLREALMLGHRIALLAAGRLAFLGTPREMLDSSVEEARAFVRTLSWREATIGTEWRPADAVRDPHS